MFDSSVAKASRHVPLDRSSGLDEGVQLMVEARDALLDPQRIAYDGQQGMPSGCSCSTWS